MAKNPLQQLDVIYNASRKGRKIVDCYRLLYKRSLWEEVLTQKRYNHHISTHMLDELINTLKQGKWTHSKYIHSTYPLLVDVLKVILVHIYPSLEQRNMFVAEHVHDALSYLQKTFVKVTWCVEGTIQLKDVQLITQLTNFLSRKIDDERFMTFIVDLITMEQRWEKERTNDLTDKTMVRSICISIFLKQVDCDVQQIWTNMNRTIYYVRCNEHFRIGVCGRKFDALTLVKHMNQLYSVSKAFEMNISHLSSLSRFLRYDIVVKRDASRNQTFISLQIPYTEMKQMIRKLGYGDVEQKKIFHRPKLVHKSEPSIIRIFNAELLRMTSYYKLASNRSLLRQLYYYAEGSFVKTIACKRRSTSRKVALKMRRNSQGRLMIWDKQKDGTEVGYTFLKLRDLS
ncbi:group II intron reverse transcriptase/maturase [Halalkalibacter hemicellulosilyticus]|uniref:RNA-directed DNA polymerase n=1 Tax=Halalkalibacter hemicellulosilyticusJCM 9152 TaxID=1236971 RepID=W4QFT2_9BACI|nr:group II intron reverse transcriptase/maturase [Halalkalibacter hemicellulosilyticus]GAE30214.1 RNA-directed DNA polymerase [Halalkalibacter hemicellulosilyticusJCM 9152]